MMEGLSIPPKNTILDKTHCLMCGNILNLHFTFFFKFENKFIRVCDLAYAKRTMG